MKIKKIIGIVMAVTILLSGCGAAAASSGQPEEDASSVESAQEVMDDSSEETIPEETADSTEESAKEETAEPSAEESQEESAEASEETAEEEAEEAEPELFEYNPHLYSTLLSKEIPQDHWDALYNLCDALRVGADIFECSSQEAYDWCMDGGTLANLFPAACMKITGESDDGSVPFENGVGRIYYKIPAEEYVEREAEFEQMVVDVLNNYIEKDDNDYEKCLKLYDYMESNYSYQYDFREDGQGDDGYTYFTFINHTGQCIDLSGVYAYLLLEAGVDALNVGCYENMDHAWTYAVVNGQGYHIDPTWALKTDRYTDSLYLNYFMMTDEIRTETGCPVGDLTVQLLPGFWVNQSSITLPATDDSYYTGDFSTFKQLDEENKVLYYLDMDDVVHELNYG